MGIGKKKAAAAIILVLAGFCLAVIPGIAKEEKRRKEGKGEGGVRIRKCYTCPFPHKSAGLKERLYDIRVEWRGPWEFCNDVEVRMFCLLKDGTVIKGRQFYNHVHSRTYKTTGRIEGSILLHHGKIVNSRAEIWIGGKLWCSKTKKKTVAQAKKEAKKPAGNGGKCKRERRLENISLTKRIDGSYSIRNGQTEEKYPLKQGLKPQMQTLHPLRYVTRGVPLTFWSVRGRPGRGRLLFHR